LIFCVYFGVPLLTINGIAVAMMEHNDIDDGISNVGSGDVDGGFEAAKAASFTKGILFPISYVGLGMKISRFGLAEKASSIGALAVYWSAQTMMEKVLDIVEALSLVY